MEESWSGFFYFFGINNDLFVPINESNGITNFYCMLYKGSWYTVEVILKRSALFRFCLHFFSKLSIVFLPLFLLSHFAPCIWSALWNSCLIQVSMSWSPGPLLLSGISQAIGLSWGPVSHTKLMSPTGNDTFSRICHSKPPQTHVISPIHSQRDCLEMHHSFKSQRA